MTAIRVSPSGPNIDNASGASLVPGTGMRLRLAEAVSPMAGTVVIPTSPSVVCSDGFGGVAPVLATLADPSPGLNYRANVSLDVKNQSTDTNGQIFLYLDTSIDGGTTFTNRAKNVHRVAMATTAEGSEAHRQIQCWLPLGLGSALGVVDASASLKIRVRTEQAGGILEVFSLASSSDDSGPVTGLNGTIHLELEECF